MYKDNFASRTEAYIFVTKKSKDLVYANAMERVEAYKELFGQKYLKFDKIEVLEDKSKADTTKELLAIRERADEFEKNKGPTDLFAIVIACIGFNMVDDYGPHQQLIRDLKDFKHVGRAAD